MPAGTGDGNHHVLKILLSQNASKHIKNNKGQTALIMAAIGKSVENVKTLVHNGASIDIQDDDGKTALMHAVIWKNRFPILFENDKYKEMVEILLAHNASVSIQDNQGEDTLAHSKKYFENVLTGIQTLLQAV